MWRWTFLSRLTSWSTFWRVRFLRVSFASLLLHFKQYLPLFFSSHILIVCCLVVRMDLLNACHQKSLCTVLSALLMLLPQSEAFNTLHKRLQAVPALTIFGWASLYLTLIRHTFLELSGTYSRQSLSLLLSAFNGYSVTGTPLPLLRRWTSFLWWSASAPPSIDCRRRSATDTATCLGPVSRGWWTHRWSYMICRFLVLICLVIRFKRIRWPVLLFFHWLFYWLMFYHHHKVWCVLCAV